MAITGSGPVLFSDTLTGADTCEASGGTTRATGGTETRPKNIAVLYYVKS
jgi:hypothetical protein